MFLEYKLKLKMIVDIYASKSSLFESKFSIGLFASKALDIQNRNTAANSLRVYLNGQRTPTEEKLKQMCDNLNISYSFMTNHNLFLPQDERIMIDFLWYELSDKDTSCSGLWSSGEDGNNPIITSNTGYTVFFKVSSLRLYNYLIELTNIKQKCKAEGNYDEYYKYILNFPFSSKIYDKNRINTNIDLSTYKFDYIHKDNFIKSILNGTYKDCDNDTIVNTDTPSVLNVNYKLKYLKQIGPSSYRAIDDKGTDEISSYCDLEARVFDTSLTLGQIINIEKYANHPISNIIDLYSKNYQIKNALIKDIVWNDLFKETMTLIEVPTNLMIGHEQYNKLTLDNKNIIYVNDYDLNDLLKEYFSVYNKYTLNNNNHLSETSFINSLLNLASPDTVSDLEMQIIISDKNKSRHSR